MQDHIAESSPNALIVHGARHVKQALSAGLPFILLSAPGAAGYAGCLWWRKLVELAGEPPPPDILDCGDTAIRAIEAIRIGQKKLILAPSAVGYEAACRAADETGSIIFPAPPPALDMAKVRRNQDLIDWLAMT